MEVNSIEVLFFLDFNRPELKLISLNLTQALMRI